MRKMIAVAEDSGFFASMLMRKLGQTNYEVEFCGNAAEVLDLFNKPDIQSRPVALVIDTMLAHGPEIPSSRTNGGLETGIVLCEILRKDNPNLLIFIHAPMNKYVSDKLDEMMDSDPNLTVVDRFGLPTDVTTSIIMERIRKQESAQKP